MSEALEPLTESAPELAPPVLGDPLDAEIARNLANCRATNTWKAYRSDWADFTAWCTDRGETDMPAVPQTIARYISDLGREDREGGPMSPSTISRRLAAIKAAHDAAEQPTPTNHPLVRQTRQGIVRRLGEAPRNQKQPVSTDDIRAASQAMGDRLIDARDRALLLIGYAVGLRRSEIAAIDVHHITNSPEGLRLRIPRSKGDQEGKGVTVPIVYGEDEATCPVRAYRAWLNRADISEGPVFRRVNRHGHVGDRVGPRAVAIVVKRHMAALGHDAKDFAGHSLRRGMATTAAGAKAPDRVIMATTRHKSPDSLTPYVDEGTLFQDPASGYLGL